MKDLISFNSKNGLSEHLTGDKFKIRKTWEIKDALHRKKISRLLKILTVWDSWQKSLDGDQLEKEEKV